jgi:hypothetical protein
MNCSPTFPLRFNRAEDAGKAAAKKLRVDFEGEELSAVIPDRIRAHTSRYASAGVSANSCQLRRY